MHHSLGLSLVLSNCLTAHYLVTFVLPVCYLLHRSSYVTKQMSQKVTCKGNTLRACYSFSDVLLQCIIFYFSLSFFPFIVFLLLLLLLLLLLFFLFVFFSLFFPLSERWDLPHVFPKGQTFWIWYLKLW